MMFYKKWLHNFWYSFPIQLLLLHFKKHQLILIYWGLLFGVVSGGFMKMFGADSLYLAPEYLDTVSGVGAAMVGMSIGVFIMAWNITTFILFSKHIKFLATTDKPFVKYCLNNFIIPTIFLIFYFFKAIQYGLYKELFDWSKIIELSIGFLIGLLLNFLLSFLYFFKADQSIYKRIPPVLKMPHTVNKKNIDTVIATSESSLLKVKTYLIGLRKTAVVRDVKHYNKAYIETVFSRHHLASVILIILAFFFLIVSSFFLDNKYFQIPAAASITVFFAILLSVFGALAYFLQNWSLPFTIGIFLLLNFLYAKQIIDPTNKAYGINYSNKENRPIYDSAHIVSLCSNEKIEKDKTAMLEILNNWKVNQQEEKPIFYLINVSGGGSRSATFSMHIMQQLDSMLNGKLLQKTFMITGASGGMLGAAYYRELYHQKKLGNITNIYDKGYVQNIGKDLLNPIFSSLVARDILSPAQKFTWQDQTYLKDRAYAFEQKFNENTNKILNKSIGDYYKEERNATLPLTIFSSVILRDGRKMMISTQPISFLMKPIAIDANINETTPDAIDFGALFTKQNPEQLSVLTALRMNATFPYVLPTVWLPSNPVIDVMDAGIRDNYGQEIATRFISVFEDWLQKNVRKIVIITIRDRKTGDWDLPYEVNNMIGSFAKPVTQLQFNIFKIQDYVQNEEFALLHKKLTIPLEKAVFQYAPLNTDNHAALSFHLTNKEKNWIKEDIMNEGNKKSFTFLKNQ
jgi:Patatin-like phospholipase